MFAKANTNETGGEIRPSAATPATPGTPTRISAGQEGGLIAVVMTIVVAASIGLIGLLVTQNIEDSTTFANETLGNATDSVGTSLADAFGLVGIVFIVLILGVLLAVLMSLSRAGGN